MQSVTPREIALIWSVQETAGFGQGWIEPPAPCYRRLLFNLQHESDDTVRYDALVRFWQEPKTKAVQYWQPVVAGEREWWEQTHDVTIYGGNHALSSHYPVCPIRIQWKGREIALRGSLAIVPRGVRFKL